MTIDRNTNTVFENRVDYPYWQGLRQGEIRMQRCDKCQNWYWPAEWRCGACGSWDLHWEAVAGEGIVHAWERTFYPFAPGFEDMIPYVNVLVELPQAGRRRILGILEGPEGGVKIGAPVIASIQAPSKRTRDLPVLWWRLKNQAAR